MFHSIDGRKIADTWAEGAAENADVVLGLDMFNEPGEA